MVSTDVSITAIIISKQGSVLSPVLKSKLDEMFYTEILSAITPSDLIRSNFMNYNDLTEVEVAISLSHHIARKRAKKLNSDWCIILEEDAIINFTKEEIIFLIQEISSKNTSIHIPLGIHLFPEQFGILVTNKRENFAKVRYLPDFAVGYVLNYSAIKKSVEFQNFIKIEVADWPKFMRSKINWFSPLVSFVLHPNFHLSGTLSATRVHREFRAEQIWVKKIFSRRNFPLLLIKVGHLLHIKFGINPIDSEKIRSILIRLQR